MDFDDLARHSFAMRDTESSIQQRAMAAEDETVFVGPSGRLGSAVAILTPVDPTHGVQVLGGAPKHTDGDANRCGTVAVFAGFQGRSFKEDEEVFV